MTLKYLLRKEFTQIRRNSFIPRLIIVFPIIIMCVMPWVMNMEVKNILVYCCPVKVLQDKKNKAETLLQDSSLFCYFACCKKR